MLRESSEKKKYIATVLAFISVPLSGFMADIYLPSFPSMAKDLQVSESQIQLTLTCFFLSYGISQLFIGSILDNIGRYKPALVALFVLALSSIWIANTSDIFLICLLRCIQGITTSALVISKRAFFLDLYTGDKLKNLLSYFTIVWSCGPILAPFLGGYLESIFHWQSNFYFLAGYASVLLILEIFLSGETIAQKSKFVLSKTIYSYKLMLGNINFLIGIIILGFGYSVVMIFNIAGPFVIENSFHFNSVVIGYCTLVLGISWMVGGIIGKKLINRPMNTKLKFATLIQICLVVVLNVVSYFYQNLALFVFIAFFIHICSGLIYNIYFTQSMVTFKSNAGMAGGLLGGMVYIITSIMSYLISTIGKIETQQDLALRYFVLSLILFFTALVALKFLKKGSLIQDKL
jgi:DHA1 family bicyclomycin/chloramphenicol resistance-like MFS transporter